jgi:hypothetical protein
MKYLLEELRLLSFVIRCFDGGLFSSPSGSESTSEGSLSDGEEAVPPSSAQSRAYRLTLTGSQIEAIEVLNEWLADSPYNDGDLLDAIDVLVQALYMPDNCDDMMAHIFVSPVMAFTCLKALAIGGGFLPPKSITGNLVALQCAIHLCIFFMVMKLWQQRKATGGKSIDPDGDWFRQVVPCIVVPPIK